MAYHTLSLILSKITITGPSPLHTWPNASCHAEWNQIYHHNLEVIRNPMVYGTSMGDLGLLSKVQVLITVIFLMEAARIYQVWFMNEKFNTLHICSVANIRKIWWIKTSIKDFNYKKSSNYPWLNVF